MNSIDTNLALDYKTMTAVLALGGEESLSILGAWNCMKTLAREIPGRQIRQRLRQRLASRGTPSLLPARGRGNTLYAGGTGTGDP